MPELPEVETVRRGLARTIIGRTVRDVIIRAPKLFPDDRSLIATVLVGARILAVERRAKVLLIDLSSSWTLAIHLKMTGQLIVVKSKQEKVNRNIVDFVGGHPEKAYEQPLPHRHTHIVITFDDGTIIYFNDLRKFGWFHLFPHKAIEGRLSVKEFLDGLSLGPEPLSDDFTVEHLLSLVQKRTIPIKQLLLEQKGIAGIGNIYADEALFLAGIHPQRRASSVQRLEIRKLHQAIRDVLEKGIEFGGTSKNTYLNVEGTKGEMQNYLFVYQRTGQPCKVCGSRIERVKIGQRSSHYCPSCQS